MGFKDLQCHSWPRLLNSEARRRAIGGNEVQAAGGSLKVSATDPRSAAVAEKNRLKRLRIQQGRLKGGLLRW